MPSCRTNFATTSCNPKILLPQPANLAIHCSQSHRPSSKARASFEQGSSVVLWGMSEFVHVQRHLGSSKTGVLCLVIETLGAVNKERVGVEHGGIVASEHLCI
mmetsp:Transcript_20208/g.43724  ORF Transcript_20208/g.43724 Transcript_20208/m.43724 type:complete len:103 (-) Transcript_20208:1782-2090(-)